MQMQEQTHQSSKFLALSYDFEEMPYLSELFESIDQLIEECAEDNGADLTQLKRFVAGHVARADLKEFPSKFETIKKKAPSNDWNTLVSIAKAQRKRARIDTEIIAYAQQLNSELNGNDLDRAKELREAVEMKKKEVEKKKEEKEGKKAEEAEGPASVRFNRYLMDKTKLHKNIVHMHESYGTNLILISANENSREQNRYRPYVYGNTSKD